MALGTASNVIVGIAQIWTAPANTAAPSLAGTGLITPPTTPWLASGFTTDGVSIDLERKTTMTYVEEQSTPVVITDDTSDFSIEFAFSEDTLANMSIAYGGGTITPTAPTLTIPGSSTLQITDAIASYAVLAIATNSFGLSRVLYVPSMVSTGKVKTSYRRSKGARVYPATFAATCALSSIQIIEATSAHS